MSTPRYAPDARITAGGAALPAALRASLASISLHNGIEGADRLELRFANEGLRWLDHPALALGTDLRLSLGYAPDPLEQVFVGDVVGQSPTFPAGGMPTLTVVAHDRRERLQRGTRKRWFAIAVSGDGTYPLPDSVVATAVATEHQLLLATDPVSLAIASVIGGVTYATQLLSPEGKQEMVRKQQGVSDFDFLGQIARENGWFMSMDHGGALGGRVLRFSSLFGAREPALTLRYGESLIDFTPRITKVGEVAAISARFWIPQAKLELKVTVGWDWDRQSLSVSVVPSMGLPSDLGSTLEGATAMASRNAERSGQDVAAARAEARGTYEKAASNAKETQGPSLTIAGQAVTAGTAARIILGKLIPKLNQRLTAAGSTPGDLRLRPGAVIALEGVGVQFGGAYRVTEAMHTFDSGGFRSAFEVRKELWLDALDVARQAESRATATSHDPGREILEVLR